MRKVNLILAVDEKNGLGKGNTIPWHISKDLKHFKEITTENEDLSMLNAVVMGRKTWQSIPSNNKPLSDRINCIITKTISTNDTDAKLDNFTLYFSSLEKCLEELENKPNLDKIFIIGGASLYNDFVGKYKDKVEKIYITKIKGDFDCDVFFDGIPSDFVVEKYSDEMEENGVKFSFWEYKKS